MSLGQSVNDQPIPDAGERPRSNGNGLIHDASDPVVSIAGLEDVDWRPSYDRDSVDRHLAAVEAEKARLLAEIRQAEERAAAAQERCQTSTTEREALLGSLLLAARAEMDRVDTEQRATVTTILSMAEEEAARIRDRAQAHAASVRDVVASLTATTPPGESAGGTGLESGHDVADALGSRGHRDAG